MACVDDQRSRPSFAALTPKTRRVGSDYPHIVRATNQTDLPTMTTIASVSTMFVVRLATRRLERTSGPTAPAEQLPDVVLMLYVFEGIYLMRTL